MDETKKKKERIRKQKWRQNLKKNLAKYEQYLKNERLRKNYSNLIKSSQSSSSSASGQSSQFIEASSEVSSETTTRTTPQNQSAFSTKQSRSRSLKKADDHLPQSPRKKAEIIQNLVSKYHIRIKIHENGGRPRKDLSKEKKDWMIEFLSPSDMTYTNPGRQVNVYIGKVGGERKYLPRQYLLWTLRDLLDIINRTESNFVSTFSEKLTFSQLCDFTKTHKQFIYNKDISHTSCLCDTCKNTALLAKGLNKRLPSSSHHPENPHDIVEKYSYPSDNKQCMSNNCEKCSSGELCQLPFNLPTESDTDSSSESDDSDNLVSFYRWKTPDKQITKL